MKVEESEVHRKLDDALGKADYGHGSDADGVCDDDHHDCCYLVVDGT